MARVRSPPLAIIIAASVACCGGRTPAEMFDPSAESGGVGGGECVPTDGCACCGGACVDLVSDLLHCGACFSACAAVAHTDVRCDEGACAWSCLDGWADCNGIASDGCEHAGPCVCQPGETTVCYDGAAGTEGVGACAAGVSTCTSDYAWGPCVGQVVPTPEACGNLIDDDCDGIDPQVDVDGDGWSACDGDCCDDLLGCPIPPHLVNPGALELPANGIDDDCSSFTADTDPFPTCGGGPLEAPTSAAELVKAMDLCQFTTESPALPQKIWGVIESSLALADGTAMPPPADVQAGVLGAYGSFVAPKNGPTMAALSSGTARAEGDPDYVHPQVGPEPNQGGNFVAGTVVSIPPLYLAAHGGTLPKPPTCPLCKDESCTTAWDSAGLTIRIRVPTNVDGFELEHRFYTAEYPEYVCKDNDDHFLALLSSRAAGLPGDRNIALDPFGNVVSVNSAFFDVCFPGPNGPPDACPSGTVDLVGTGMGGWDGALNDGAATSWSTATAPVVPGETIELELVIWDGADGNVDSLALIDHARWIPIR